MDNSFTTRLLLFLGVICSCGIFLTVNDVSAQLLRSNLTSPGQIPTRVAARTAKAALGEQLFFDKRLSIDETVSCATCHDPASAFAGNDALAVGVRQQKGTRNAPTLLNSVFSNSYFWDGRVNTLEEQAKQPILNASEMDMGTERVLVERLSSIDDYRQRFRRIFPKEGISLDTVASAIAAYERTLLSRNSPFDRFMEGDSEAITQTQKRGWELFKGKASCIDCHHYSKASPFFTDSKFYNTGVSTEDLARRVQEVDSLVPRAEDAGRLAHQSKFSDLGRFLVTRQVSNVGAFKTPTLRDIELTWPYMHNGSIKTLLDVVKFYNQGGNKNPNLDIRLHPLNLTDEEMSCIVEFMRALTSENVLREAQSSKPQSRTSVSTPP